MQAQYQFVSVFLWSIPFRQRTAHLKKSSIRRQATQKNKIYITRTSSKANRNFVYFLHRRAFIKICNLVQTLPAPAQMPCKGRFARKAMQNNIFNIHLLTLCLQNVFCLSNVHKQLTNEIKNGTVFVILTKGGDKLWRSFLNLQLLLLSISKTSA